MKNECPQAQRGRPPVMTESVRTTILAAMREGLSADAAARVAGVSPSTLRSHRRRERDFATALLRAGAESQRSLLAKIKAADDWKASAFLLARRHPEEWGRWREDERPKPRRVRGPENGLLELPADANPAMIAAHDRMLAALNEYQLEESRAKSP